MDDVSWLEFRDHLGRDVRLLLEPVTGPSSTVPPLPPPRVSESLGNPVFSGYVTCDNHGWGIGKDPWSLKETDDVPSDDYHGPRGGRDLLTGTDIS